MMSSGNFNKKPESMIKSGLILLTSSQTLPSLSSSFEKMMDSTPNFSALLKTPAEALFVKIAVTSTDGFSAKYRMIFSAFEPAPEANITRRFIVLQKNEYYRNGLNLIHYS